ncbi:NB-ARC domain-containing protein [Dactylosporangium darangshiense]|uniref:Peptidase C14 caspase domain-containing protein n=1 Tax=Dactylosporangium darangshiense TaxID=579108 RepID=A0ABP8DSW2_9ACTN
MSAGDAAGVSRADPSESAAVLVGVSTYRSDFPAVPQAVAGMRRLAEQFALPQLWGLRPSRLIALEDPDRAVVLQAVGDAARLVRPPGLLVIYFVGHAEAFGEQLCLVPVDGDRSRPQRSMVTVADLVDEVARNGSPDLSVLLLLDCCFAGHADASVPVRAVPGGGSAGWYLIGATDRTNPAQSGQGRELTLFTEMLLRVIQGLPDRGASLRGCDVFDELVTLLREHPPVHNGAPPGSLPWLVNRSYRPPPLTPVAVGSPTVDAVAVARRPRMLPPVPPGAIARPGLTRMLLETLEQSSQADPIVVTAVRGFGGFGKTVLVTQACHEPAVEARFPGGVLWTELGQDLLGPALAAKINDLSARLTGVRPTSSDPLTAGFHLGEALDLRTDPVLLVVDDVWRDEQARPFLVGGERCRRVITTRFNLPSLAAATTVSIDVMGGNEAATLLKQDAGLLPADVLAELARLSGRWPLLLGIINRTIARTTTATRTAPEAAHMVLDRLRQAGPAGLDNPWADDTSRRNTMISACIEGSLASLRTFVRDRYLELGIFVEDTDIPYRTLALLWAETGGLDAFQTEQLGQTLIDASLATPARREPGLRLHDVLRSYLRDIAAVDQAARTNTALLDAAARLLPETAAQRDHAPRAWWALPPQQEYLWRHIVDHLTAAGRGHELDRLLMDLRWTAARIHRDGPVHAEADLIHCHHPDAPALADAIRRNAHLLTPGSTAHSIHDSIASRLDGNPILQPHVEAFAATLTHRPRIANLWPPPDQPNPALRRSIHTGHPAGVAHVHIAPDGTWLATTGGKLGAGDSVMRIWDLATGEQTHRLDTDHPGGVAQVHIAPDGAWLATTGAGYRTRDPVVRIWDVATGEQTHRLDTGHPNGVEQVHVAPDGTWLATAGGRGDPVVRIWDVATGQQTYRLGTDHPGGIGEVHVAPDGTWLATTGAAGDPMVRIWDVATGEQTHRLDTGHPAGVGHVHVAPDGTWLVTTGAGGDPVVRILELATGRQTHRIDTGHHRGVGQVHIAPDESWLATIGVGYSADDAVVRVWDLATGRQTHQLDTGHSTGLGPVHVAPDGTWLATNGGSGARVVRVWNLSTGQQTHQLDTGHRDGVRQVYIAPDGAWLATSGGKPGAGDSVVRIWDPATGQQTHRLDTGHPTGVGQVHMTPDGAWLATTGMSGDPVLRIWDLPTGEQARQLDTSHPGVVGQVHMAPDRTWLATTGGGYGADDPVVRIWDLDTGEQTRQLDTGHRHGVAGVYIAPDGAWLATTGGKLGADDPVVRIWDVATGEQTHRLDTARSGGVAQVHIAPDGAWLATTDGVGDPVVRIWDVATGEQTHRLDTGHRDGVGQVRIAPDGAWLSTTSAGYNTVDQAVRIWDVATGEQTHRLDTAHRHGVAGVYIAPDGAWLATTGGGYNADDPVVQIWDPGTGKQTHRLDTGHRRGVAQVSIAPDGTWLATAGGVGDPVLRIWDVATGRQTHQLDTDHHEGVGQVHIAPDGTWLTTLGAEYDSIDPIVRVWDAATGQQTHQLDNGHHERIRGTIIPSDSQSLLVLGVTFLSYWSKRDSQMAAIRLDGAIAAWFLGSDDQRLILGGSRGIYGYRIIS